MRQRHLTLLILGASVAVASWRVFRQSCATDTDASRAMPGDALIERPRWTMTLGVTVQARTELIWPWLVQIGYQRGGLYSYDWLDCVFGILDRPSADQVLPEFQELCAGDVIPLGSGPNWPVAAVEPKQSLVLAPAGPGFSVSWAFLLDPVDDRSTRLLTRVKADYDLTRATAPFAALIDPLSFVMTRRMLLGIKQRAERLATMHDDQPKPQSIGLVPASRAPDNWNPALQAAVGTALPVDDGGQP